MSTQEMALLQKVKEEGRAEGITERNFFFVKNLFLFTNLKDEKMAALAGVPVEFVKEVKEKFLAKYQPLTKTGEIAIEIMRRDGMDIEKSLEQDVRLMELYMKSRDSPDMSKILDEKLPDLLKDHYI